MDPSTSLSELGTQLRADRIPFVEATVVRAQAPTSARPGDTAIVQADGTIAGFVGGQCAETSVVAAALDVLVSGEPLLLRVLPDGSDREPALDERDAPGERRVINPCLSGGAIEVFLRPHRPAPAVHVVGSSPVALALTTTLAGLGFSARRVDGGELDCTGALAVVVSTHGRDEPETIRAAIAAAVPFIGLIASERRGSAVLDAMDLSDEERGRVRTPVGLPIGARTPAEIALSIAAELVRDVRLGDIEPSAAPIPSTPATAIDPVCGMTVTVTATTLHLAHDGQDVWFCAPGCRARYAADVGVEV
ncbi:MAG: XdhC family protein [Nitriliruptor sp.]|uniref:XdhC family protein n=1 Tax=Nitriliruptor sp. TaxID=2448056 RepID=UPI0034A0AE1A